MAEHFFGKTDTGKQRKNNEDTFLAEDMGGGLVAACVIDGVGGYEGGEIAAEVTRKCIKAALADLPGNVITGMKDAFAMANAQILEEKKKNPEYERMACVATMAMADLAANKFYFTHIGDTRLYLLRDKSLVKITHDHSVVGFLEESGRLTEEAAMQHPKRNEINKALGFGEVPADLDDFFETGESPFLPGDILLLCSDGLTDMLSSETMREILLSSGSLKSIAKKLIDHANDAGGKDNITVVLMSNTNPRSRPEVLKPATSAVKIPSQVSVPGNDTLPGNFRTPIDHRRTNTGWLIFFILLSLALGGLLAWNYFFKEKPAPTKVEQIGFGSQGKAEQEFMNMLNNSDGDTVRLSATDFPNPLLITAPLQLDKDSLYVYGNGLVLKADSAYHGAAFNIPASAKLIMLDSLAFENFEAAIVLRSPSLFLRAVNFKNCIVPIQYGINFELNNPVSGFIRDSIFQREKN